MDKTNEKGKLSKNGSNNFIDSGIDFNSRILTKPKYTPGNKKINLTDTVFVFNNGNRWIIMSKEDLEVHPIIHDVYYDEKEGNGEMSASDITITYCPFSGSCIIYFGKWFCNGQIYKNNIILSKGKLSVSQLSCPTCEGELIRREEVNVMTLRNALGKYPDCSYLSIDKHKFKPIVRRNYGSNYDSFDKKINADTKYHPKSIVFGINYLSNNSNKNKYSVIIPKGTSKDIVGNIDINKNGIEQYFVEMLDSVRERGGIIIPSYWFSWIDHFELSKVVEL